MKEFKLAKGWAIIIYIFAPLMIAVFGWLLLLPLIPGEKHSPGMIFWLAPICLAMIALMVVALADARKARFVIDTDKIYSESVFTNRELLFTEIKGYRLQDKYIFIEANTAQKKRIRISTYFAHTDDIIEWLAQKYPNLDVVQVQQEEEEILHNEAFGMTTEQREEKLTKGRKAAKIVNGAGIVLAALALFYPHPYEYILLACMAVPLIAIVVLKTFNGLIKVTAKKDTAYPSVFWAVCTSSMAVLFRSFWDYNIFDHSKIWLPVIIITAVLAACILLVSKKRSAKSFEEYSMAIVIAALLFGYSYGSVVMVNCYYDTSAPENFTTQILHKRISKGKSTTYYFELAAWGPQKESKEVSVGRQLFNTLNTDDDVNIYFSKGRFDIPWFLVTE